MLNRKRDLGACVKSEVKAPSCSWAGGVSEKARPWQALFNFSVPPSQHFLVALLVPSLLFCLTQANHGKVTASKPPKSKPWIRLLFPFSPDFPLLSSPSNAVHHSLQSRPISIIPASSQIPRQRRHPNVTALLWSVACWALLLMQLESLYTWWHNSTSTSFFLYMCVCINAHKVHTECAYL